MSTFDDMVNKIASDMQRSDLKTQIGTAINRAIRYYYDKDPFYFNEATATFTTTQGQKIYTPSDTNITDIAKILQVEIEINPSTNISLTPRTFQYIQDVNINNTQGQPFDYAYYNESFYIYPVPDNTYTITVFYNNEFQELSGAESNAFTTDAEDLIEARARWSLYKAVIRNKDAALDAKEQETDALQAIRTATARRVSTGKVRPIKF